MVKVKINDTGIKLEGHAGYHNNGADVVCSAISALTCNLINSLQNLTKDKIATEISSGYTEIQWKALTEEGRLLVDSWFLGITAVNQQYKCIDFV
ncbi:MAG: ribosomal-processing cysteine protease Prp [Lachnospira sp.]|nr:ribosomal-processing cysteine protease Prp [Lachnospira sp.]